MGKDLTRKEELALKYPETERHYQAVKQGIFDPPIERLGETTKEQKQRSQS